MTPGLNEDLMQLREMLCVDDDHYCRACFLGGPHASAQNPPNVFRNQLQGVRPRFFFVFDKPNDNDRLKAKGLKWAPVDILDDRDSANPTRLNLVKLLNILGLVGESNGASGVLSSSMFHITNAVKCDKCAVSGATGQVEIGLAQAEQCKRNFFFKELELLKPKALVMFGANPDKFITGRVGKIWVVRDEMVNGQIYKVVRVPHTTATPFNTHGKRGQAYKEKLPDFWISIPG